MNVSLNCLAFIRIRDKWRNIYNKRFDNKTNFYKISFSKGGERSEEEMEFSIVFDWRCRWIRVVLNFDRQAIVKGVATSPGGIPENS